MGIKLRDDEKLVTVAVCALFTIVMLIVLFTAGNVLHMGALLSILAVITILGTGVSWYIVLKNMYDPNYDHWRWLCILFAVATIIIVMGSRAGWLENNQMEEDSKVEHTLP